MTGYEPRHQQRPPTSLLSSEPPTEPSAGPVMARPTSKMSAVRAFYGKGGKVRKTAVWAATVFLALAVIGTVAGPQGQAPPKPAQVVMTTQRVPNLYGFTQDDARRVLGMEGFTTGVVTPQKPGQVLWVRSQSPKPGTPVAPGTPVSLTSLPGQPGGN